MSGAGKLDRRVVFERATLVDDGYTEVPAWEPLFSAWASISPLSDGERWRAGQAGATSTHRITVRFSSLTASLTARDRVRIDGRVLDLGPGKEVGRKEFLEFLAEEPR